MLGILYVSVARELGRHSPQGRERRLLRERAGRFSSVLHDNSLCSTADSREVVKPGGARCLLRLDITRPSVEIAVVFRVSRTLVDGDHTAPQRKLSTDF